MKRFIAAIACSSLSFTLPIQSQGQSQGKTPSPLIAALCSSNWREAMKIAAVQRDTAKDPQGKAKWEAYLSRLNNISTGALKLSPSDFEKLGCPKTTVVHNITGTVKIDSYVTDGKVCIPTAGFGDIREGAQIIVKDKAEQVIAAGELGQGQEVRNSQYYTFCQFSFAIANVPQSDFYAIAISKRGGLLYSAKDLKALNWNVALVLGSLEKP